MFQHKRSSPVDKRSRIMNQHLHLVTLGVRDLEKSRKFYTEILGWKPSSASNDDVTFIQTGGVVDLKSKGVKIVKEPQKAFWGGYSSYFADPDDNRWEVAYNPFFPFDENGNLNLG